MKKKLRSEFNPRQYMLETDFELYYYSDSHFPSVEKHTHPYTEVYLFIEGNVAMEIEGIRYPLSPGDLLVIPKGTMHRAVIQSHEPYRRFVFWISENFRTQLKKESEDYVYLFNYVSKKKQYVFHMETLSFSSIRSQLLQLLEELHTNHFGKDTKIGLDVRNLILRLSRIIYTEMQPKAKKENISAYQSITEYIGSHLDEDLSLERLSTIFYLNRYYIAHLFQENAGISIHQYITKKRLQACADALTAGQLPTQCFEAAGFLNYSSFYRAFRKEYNCSPSDFMDQHIWQ